MGGANVSGLLCSSPAAISVSSESDNELDSSTDIDASKKVHKYQQPAVPKLQLQGISSSISKLDLPRPDESVSLPCPSVVIDTFREEQDALNSAREAQRELETLLAEIAAPQNDQASDGKASDELAQTSDGESSEEQISDKSNGLKEASDELAQVLQKRRRLLEGKGGKLEMYEDEDAESEYEDDSDGFCDASIISCCNQRRVVPKLHLPVRALAVPKLDLPLKRRAST